MNTPKSIANAPRTEGGAWDAPRTEGGAWDAPRTEGGAWDAPRTEGGAWDAPPPVDTPAVAPHVPAPLTPERPDDGADDRTTAALGDLMPTPGD